MDIATFFDKIKFLKCVQNIYWPFIKTHRLSSKYIVQINRSNGIIQDFQLVTMFANTFMNDTRIVCPICTFYWATHDLTSWPRGSRVALWNQRTRVDSWVDTFNTFFFFFFLFSVLMLNYFQEWIWNYTDKCLFLLFNVLYWIILERCGGGVKLCPPER